MDGWFCDEGKGLACEERESLEFVSMSQIVEELKEEEEMSRRMRRIVDGGERLGHGEAVFTLRLNCDWEKRYKNSDWDPWMTVK